MILKLTLLMSVALLADLALRRASAAVRHLVWTLALVSSLALPFADWYAPRVAGGAFLIRTAVAGSVLDAPAKFPWVMAIYLLGVAILIMRLVLDVLAANRLVSRAQPTSLPGVLVSDQATVPFAWGSIVVPVGMEDHDAVIAHEAAHLERGDVWSSVLARVACAVYWFHPLVWWAAARMRLEADRACDDAVLRAGFSEPDYAGELVRVARNFSASRLAPGAVERSQLEARVRHILSTGVNRGRLGMAAICMGVCLCAAVFSPLAAIAKPDPVYKMGPGMAAPSVLHKVDPEYTSIARKSKLSGTVLLTLTVGQDGLAHDIRVVRSLEPGLDQNAVRAVRQWKFKPARRQGEPVSVKATIEVNYRLK